MFLSVNLSCLSIAGAYSSESWKLLCTSRPEPSLFVPARDADGDFRSVATHASHLENCWKTETHRNILSLPAQLTMTLLWASENESDIRIWEKTDAVFWKYLNSIILFSFSFFKNRFLWCHISRFQMLPLTMCLNQAWEAIEGFSLVKNQTFCSWWKEEILN